MKTGASKRNCYSMFDESLEAIVPSKSDEFRNYLKRPKTSPQTSFMMNIDDLHDFILLEVLSRLPNIKTVVKCKSVSKRWLALISDHTFLSRYLSLQEGIFSDQNGFFTTTELPMLETDNFSFDFLPCYQSAQDTRLKLDSPLVTSCNDLVLWCASKMFQRDYYICNPYTKQWIALPRPPQCDWHVKVGFICAPYYYGKENVENDNDFNVDYKYAIVRILPLPVWRKPEVNVEMFSSETGKWISLVIPCPPGLIFSKFPYEYPGVPYKGKLYWMHDHPHPDKKYMISLDPFSKNINNSFDRVDDISGFESGEAISVNKEGRIGVFRYMVPCWPSLTPVPKIRYNHEDTHAAHLNTCSVCSNNTTEDRILYRTRHSLYYTYSNPYHPIDWFDFVEYYNDIATI